MFKYEDGVFTAINYNSYAYDQFPTVAFEVLPGTGFFTKGKYQYFISYTDNFLIDTPPLYVSMPVVSKGTGQVSIITTNIPDAFIIQNIYRVSANKYEKIQNKVVNNQVQFYDRDTGWVLISASEFLAKNTANTNFTPSTVEVFNNTIFIGGLQEGSSNTTALPQYIDATLSGANWKYNNKVYGKASNNLINLSTTPSKLYMAYPDGPNTEDNQGYCFNTNSIDLDYSGFKTGETYKFGLIGVTSAGTLTSVIPLKIAGSDTITFDRPTVTLTTPAFFSATFEYDATPLYNAGIRAAALVYQNQNTIAAQGIITPTLAKRTTKKNVYADYWLRGNCEQMM